MSYRQQRDYENLNKAIFIGSGAYNIPVIRPDDPPVENWISFNYARGCDEPERHGIHFFIDDYQFVRVWKQPDTYVTMLQKFQAVCTPDFSTYTDFPLVVQLYNHYRKHWLGAYWQQNGLRVVPTISWAGPESYSWCFDGEPIDSTVAVSSVGTQVNRDARKLFVLGYNEMLVRLQPRKIIMYGNVPDECTGNIVQVKAFQSKWREDKGGAE